MVVEWGAKWTQSPGRNVIDCLRLDMAGHGTNNERVVVAREAVKSPKKKKKPKKKC